MTASLPAAAQSVALRGPPRDFGYFVGDVIVTEVTISSQPDMRYLPIPGPINASIELRRIDVLESDPHKTVLRLEYQSFFAPEQVMQTELPGYDIRLAHGVAHVPAWPFHVSPLRVAQRSGADAAALHGNLPIQPLPEQAVFIWLLISASIAAMAGFLFAGTQGWLPGIGRPTKPFAAAARRVAKLRAPETEAALRELQRAFDTMDGRHVFHEDVDDVLKRHGAFADLRSEILHFFDVAQNAFFAPAMPLRHEEFHGIVKLAKALRRAERRW
jgi:mxaA protein